MVLKLSLRLPLIPNMHISHLRFTMAKPSLLDLLPLKAKKVDMQLNTPLPSLASLALPIVTGTHKNTA